MDQILSHSALLVDVVKDLASSTDPKVVLKFMSMNTSQFLTMYKDRIQAVIANTLCFEYPAEGGAITFHENFKSEAESLAFVRELSGGDLVMLIQEIYKDNFLPLAESLGLKGKSLGEILSNIQAMKIPTSSPS